MGPKFAAYSVSFSAMFLGRVATVVAAQRNNLADLEGEVFLLVERGQRLHWTTIAGDLKKVDENLREQFNSEFMLNEALGMAESGVAKLRLDEFAKTKDERLFLTGISHTKIRDSALGWSIELAPWTKELEFIANQSHNAALQEWLRLVLKIRSFLIVTPHDLSG